MADEETAQAKLPQDKVASKESPKSNLVGFLEHPAVVFAGLVGAIASLVGIPLSIYLYYAARAYPELMYHVNPVKTIVVRAGEASKLSASFEGQSISTDVTATQVAIWNRGRQSVKREHVLEPIVIYTDNNTPVLEATLRKSSRDVTQLSLNTDELQKGRVAVLWNILEQNDGGVIQLIYAGNPTVNIHVTGVIEGQPQIEQLEFSGKIESPNDQYESQISDNRFRGYLLYIVALLLVLPARRILNLKRGDGQIGNLALGHVRKDAELLHKDIEFWTTKAEKLKESELKFQKHTEMMEKSEEAESLTESYRELGELIRDHLKKLESQRDNRLTIEKEMIISSTKHQRGSLWRISVVLVGMLVCFLLATYLTFIKQPSGPPFGF